MRISKKGIGDIINRLYTVEQDGEKVIRRDRLDELFTIVTGRYDNAGCSVEKVLSGEKLVITSMIFYSSLDDMLMKALNIFQS